MSIACGLGITSSIEQDDKILVAAARKRKEKDGIVLKSNPSYGFGR